jgi:uncharacterized protein YjbI with pentapeptide repeats
MRSMRLAGREFKPGSLFLGTDLRGADLTGCILNGVNFTGARLQGACLAGASLHGANLSNANVTGELGCEILTRTPTHACTHILTYRPHLSPNHRSELDGRIVVQCSCG